MKVSTEAPKKTLFVGKQRICQQVAYVLDIQDYVFVEKLTKQNWEQYCDYRIYVCEYKRKSRKFVRLKNRDCNQLNILYLDDICHLIDGEQPINGCQDVKAVTADKTNTKSAMVKTVNQSPQQQPLINRIMRGMKHPLRAAWHVVLRIKCKVHQAVKRHRAAAKQRRRAAAAERKRRLVTKQKRQAQRKRQKQIYGQIRKGNLEYLRRLQPSELFLYVLRAKPNQQVQCTRLETNMRVGSKGDIKGCSSAIVAFGNLLNDGKLDEVYHSRYARIVKLSSLNRSYCLCDLSRWCKGYCSKEKSLPTEQWQTPVIPVSISLNFDHSCNLCCKSCRTKPFVMDNEAQRNATTMTTKLLHSGYLDQTQTLQVAGMGETFYSPYYRQLLTTDLQRKEIKILSNGTLFNESNWRLLANKYTIIDVNISVDAATATTYQKLRGADFNNLLKNLNMLADLHRQKRIRNFNLNFVVQRENFREMAEFVRLGQTLGVDRIQFQRLNNFHTMTPAEFLEQCLIIDNTYLDYKLWCVLQAPIFADPIVDLQGLQRYIDASEKRYRKCYAGEQKQRQSA